ncbi:MAG: PilN domain-containing protein [Fibromonadales bacterium]|nr:PilN domain-containing protein [Fibromonadales bacterium]
MANQLSLVEINLLPNEYRQVKIDLSWLSDMRVIWSTFGLIFVFLFLSGVYYYVKETTAELEKAVEQTKIAVERERHILKKINELEAMQASIKQKIDALRSIQVSRERWVILLQYIYMALKDTPGTWITAITQNGNQMDISGLTWNFDEVAKYMTDLEKQKDITGITLTSISATKVNNENAYNFSFKVAFNPNLGLEDGVR